MAGREVERWVTSNGRHIPIFKLTEEEKQLKAEADEVRNKGIDAEDWDTSLGKNPIPQLDAKTGRVFDKLLTPEVLHKLSDAEEQTISTNIPIFSAQSELRLFSYNYHAEHEDDKPIQLIKISKGYVVVDGNHRLLKASMDNRKTIRAKVYDMSKIL